jgi:hypothetical protein
VKSSTPLMTWQLTSAQITSNQERSAVLRAEIIARRLGARMWCDQER